MTTLSVEFSRGAELITAIARELSNLPPENLPLQTPLPPTIQNVFNLSANGLILHADNLKAVLLNFDLYELIQKTQSSFANRLSQLSDDLKPFAKSLLDISEIMNNTANALRGSVIFFAAGSLLTIIGVYKVAQYRAKPASEQKTNLRLWDWRLCAMGGVALTAYSIRFLLELAHQTSALSLTYKVLAHTLV